ncbi:uncharacterized protein LOC124418977 [Lucilia cuprina]|uniref:uncharacterized protein LOC124418977 n=1 Tax=Lucilia cuprina TaxID=7375 RepID=UPI001F05C00C|nr:uncharacterized protein LOC124418977 [Lucilia cuprina]
MSSPVATASNTQNASSSNNGDGSNVHIAASSIHKLPPFWKENPKLWLMQIESIFGISGITRDETKFQYVIGNIDSNFLPHVSDILESPPSDGTSKYQAVKDRLIGTFSESQESKLRRLLKSHQLGDQKPSHFLQVMRNLASGQLNDALLKTLFLEQLPEDVRSILVISQVSDVSALAHQADKIMSLRSPQLFEMKSTPDNPDISMLCQKIDALEKKLNNFSRGRSTERYQNRNSSASGKARNRSKSRNKDWCWYHNRFADKATKCNKPCSFSKN